MIKGIYKLYEFYSLTYFKILIANSHFTDIQTYIQSELKKITKINGIDQNRLITFLLSRAVMYNNLFLGMDKDSLGELIEQYEYYIEPTDLEQIQNDLDFDPNNFELSNMNIRLYEPDFSKFDENEIETILQFVVPYKIQEEKKLKLEENVDLFFNSITSLFQDPIFSFYDEIDIAISGMPVSFFSDTIGNLQSSTLITIKIPYFYHPQFDIVDKKYVEKDLKLEAAKRGGKYYPHKDFIIEKSFEAFELNDFPLDIEQEAITSEFISNYMVTYFTKYGEKIHHEVFTITNFNSYFKAKNKYLQEINKFLIDDDLIHIKKFLHESKITKSRDFLDFCYKFLELTIKKSIEYGGLNNNFWDNDSPILEPKAQPIIFNTIRYLAEIKGIQISRETVASNGSLDFHFSYNTGDELLKVCVELKNAHHGSLLHGINTQLPLYITDVGRKEGIFLVLWYKSEKFNEPTKYKNIEELQNDLVKDIPKKFKIKPLIIDCTPKISPSKKGSEERLPKSTILGSFSLVF